jgi:hypothetical protein
MVVVRSVSNRAWTAVVRLTGIGDLSIEDRDAGLEYPLGVPVQLLALLTCRANVGD